MAAIGDYEEKYAMLDIGLSQLLLVSRACFLGGVWIGGQTFPCLHIDSKPRFEDICSWCAGWDVWSCCVRIARRCQDTAVSCWASFVWLGDGLEMDFVGGSQLCFELRCNFCTELRFVLSLDVCFQFCCAHSSPINEASSPSMHHIPIHWLQQHTAVTTNSTPTLSSNSRIHTQWDVRETWPWPWSPANAPGASRCMAQHCSQEPCGCWHMVP